MKWNFTPVIMMVSFAAVTTTLPAQSFDGCTDLTHSLYSSDQLVKPGKNSEKSYAKQGTTLSDVSYTTDTLSGSTCMAATTCSDGSSSLMYEVYYPNIQYSDKNKLPAIILFHGGGFSDCSSYQNGDGMETYCKEFAKRGFVAFNVEYRRGRVLDPDNKYTSASQMLAYYRACQDGRGALRTIADRELKKTEPYRIDLNNMFVGGCSAGGYIALNIAYYTSTMDNQIFKGIKDCLQSIDHNNYAGNASPDSYTIRGILNLWGATNIPIAYKDNPEDFFLQNAHLPAFIAFHGSMDYDANITSKNVFFSPSNSSYSKESYCVTQQYSEPDNGSDADLIQYGSQKLYETFTSAKINMKSELYIDCDMGHGLDESTSDFGLKHGDASAVTNDQVEQYIVERAATFFQYVMNNNFPYTLKNSKFVDCENKRYGCNADAKRNCTGTTSCSVAQQQNSNAISQSVELAKVSSINKLIYIHLLQPGDVIVDVYTLNGIQTRSLKTNNVTITINANSFASGIYLVRIIQGTKTRTYKVVLE